MTNITNLPYCTACGAAHRPGLASRGCFPLNEIERGELMAAAPDLLAALKDVTAALERTNRNTVLCEHTNDLIKRLEGNMSRALRLTQYQLRGSKI